MKKTILILCTWAIATMAYGQKSIGGDKDAHGCIGAAGYTWSAVKKTCIRVFEQPIQLKEINPKQTYTTSAAVVFSADNKQAEVFLPSSKSGIILSRKGKKGHYAWKKGDLTLLHSNGYSLKQANQVIYSEH